MKGKSMPSYEYQCKKCKGEVAVDRKMSDSDVKPTTEEMKDLDAKCEHELQRIIGSFTKTHGPNFGSGRKGTW